VYPFDPSRRTLPSQSTTVAFSAMPGHAALRASAIASEASSADPVIGEIRNATPSTPRFLIHLLSLTDMS
jgi:hypothetical protein